jgi:predicted DsbA family dithiol-disulfide isomerase
MVTLDILSDPVCPWCWIGWANLARAMEARPDHALALAWHPFQLNPDMPVGGMDRAAYLEAKFGGRDRAVAIYARVEAAASAAGLEIAWDRITRMPNTLDAHRVIHWAGIEGRQTPVAVAMFHAYWREGRDIGDRDVLTDVAGSAGMDPRLVAALLAGDADRAEIAARDAHARARGVTGVPTFVVAGAHAVVGAQPVALWQSVIDEVAAGDRGAQGASPPAV